MQSGMLPTARFSAFWPRGASFVAVRIARSARYNSPGNGPDRMIAPSIGDEGDGERRLVLESARFLEGGRYIRGGTGHGGSKGCDGTDGAGACRADGHAGRYALSKALHHHSVLAGEARLCSACRL